MYDVTYVKEKISLMYIVRTFKKKYLLSCHFSICFEKYKRKYFIFISQSVQFKK